ncbi:MAG: single-stranded DNA-binding protein [Betaproteobacteria bacterium]|nr:single-stranded DNA-binding protein [Betaproteobacteria bacterium]
MASVNKCIFIGNLGRDPEMRYTPNGDAIANFSIACTDRFKGKNGERQERTEWVRIVIFGKLAAIAGEYLKKGSPVYVEGRMQTRKWQNKEGHDQYTTEIVVDQMQMLSTRDGGGANAAYDGGMEQLDRGDDYNQTSDAGQQAKPSAQSGSKPATSAGRFDDFEDDIPF